MIVAVTGGIGSGKSAVCSILESEYGYPVYEADVKVKELYSSVPGLLDKIERALKADLRDAEGNFLPSALAAMVFTDSDALEIVESIVFPELVMDFRRWAHDKKSEILVFESATILEKKQFDGFADLVVLVNAPVEVRLARACARDGKDKDSILARMKCQTLMNDLSEGKEDPRIDYVIDNSGDYLELGRNTASFVEKMLLNKNVTTMQHYS